MKLKHINLLLLAFSFFTAGVQAMEERPQPQEIFIYNEKTGYLLNVPVAVTYNFRGKVITTSINKNSFDMIGSGKAIRGETPLKIAARGDILGKMANPTEITKDQMLDNWDKVRTDMTDPLVITVSPRGWSPPYTLEVTYGRELPTHIQAKQEKRAQKKQKNVLEAFSRIRYWQLQDSLTEDQILRADSWKDILVRGTIANTTAEDVYRYILDIQGKLYTKEQVNTAFKALSLQWHPDQVTEENKAIADKVFILLKKAQEGLLQAIEEKPELIEYAQKQQEVEEGWVKVEK